MSCILVRVFLLFYVSSIKLFRITHCHQPHFSRSARESVIQYKSRSELSRELINTLLRVCYMRRASGDLLFLSSEGVVEETGAGGE